MQQIGTNQQQMPAVETTSMQLPKQNNFLTILLSVLLFVSVLIAGFFAYQTQNLVKELNSLKTNTQKVEPTPVSTSDPTADWKTYNNALFTFRYPSDAKLEVQSDGVVRVMYMGQKQIDSGRTQTSLFDGYGFFVSTQNNASTLEQEYQKRVESFNNVCDQNKMGSSKILKIDRFQALQYDSSCLGDYTTSLVINNYNTLFELSQLYVGEIADQNIYKEITNQILSTFKFTSS